MLEDTQLRLLIFVSVLIAMAALETLLPKRERIQSRKQRWATNLSLVVVNSVVLKLLGPISAMLAAEFAIRNNWGLLSLIPWHQPLWVDIIIGIVLLDFAIYLQHLASHRMPFLWRFHKVHHADRDIDVTTGVRFHPIEAALSMLYKCIVILIFGPLVVAVLLFEIILNALAMFNHANIALPNSLDSILRVLLVTPDFHRVHHSVIDKETNSNYGFFLSIWDKYCKTYTEQPRDNHFDMTIGLQSCQTTNPNKLLWCLSLPFKTMQKKENA